ncbi:abhd2b [Symbiodinium pilosum]|uniref:Abhd2b protein n=1 Tax=Symbiodinium pilosum TaxID=2952 RepID=A0A812IXW4_SYMPI|nr:abhd2b [Symbiodinium pilosum]
MQRIIAQCPALQAVYWPTFYAHTAMQQFMLLGLKEMRSFLQFAVYQRQMLELRDTSQIALDWVEPRFGSAIPDGPICILLHGAIQASFSATMKDMAVELANRGLTAVVMNRRGYGDVKMEVDTARMTLYGIDEDLDEVLLEVGRRYPGRLVALVGFSCGAGYAGRYAAVRAHLSAWAKDAENGDLSKTIPRILCAVCYDSGYCVLRAVERVPRPYVWGLDLAFRYQYAIRHRETWTQKSRSFADVVKVALNPARSFVEVYDEVMKLSGFGCSKRWKEKQQPAIGEVKVPCLLVNSRDDPISVWENVEDHTAEMQNNPCLALAELYRGAHGCKFDFWGFHCWGNTMIAEFILAAASELKQARASGDPVLLKGPLYGVDPSASASKGLVAGG